ncbi:hypothetical protein B0T11DRAFT_269514 [Plectosphaerella cucumerina]|uniref:HMG box domain-containing protein n=1 Tax=Plectosphaerella cucumerina TaxID=40658 RepID=A0A8K0TUK5_9PEZI|nr:hypothetical protein B0T11DRAFT_269514 [Plectosphaerella cucumerina]
MPRVSKKAQEANKAAALAAAPPPVPQPIAAVQPIALAVQPHQVQRQIDVDGFIRVRDSVHNRLLTILDLIRGFSVDYYRQTSLLLGEHSQDGVPGIDFPLPQLDHAVQSLASIPGFLQPGQEPAPAVEEKKERKKRSHDPNAPKRPLTPYFLYMQTARPIIASDLGAEAPKGAVQEEGQRRWKAMGVQEKSGWNNAYQYNLRLYQARVHSYKQGGNPDAKLMTDEEAQAYADENNIVAPADAPVADDHEAIAEQLGQGAPVEASDEDAPPAKTPKKPVSRKRKSEVAEVEAPKVPAASAVATPDTTKKRRRTSKAADAETTETASTKKGARGKKAKN